MIPHNLRLKILNNLALLGSEKVIRLIINFSLTIFIAKMVNVREYGIFQLIVSTGVIFFQIIDYGTSELFIEKLSRRFSKKLFSEIIFFRVSTAMIAIVIGNLFFPIFYYNKIEYWPYFTLFTASYLFRAFDAVNFFLQVNFKNEITAKIGFITTLINSPLKLFLVYEYKNLLCLVFSALLEHIITALLLIKKYSFNIKNKVKGIYFNTKFLKKCFPIFLSSTVFQLSLRSDTIIAGIYLNNYDLGNYMLANRFIMTFMTVAYILSTVTYPLMASSSQDTLNSKIKEVSSLFNLAALLIIPISIYIIPLVISFFDLSKTYLNTIKLLQLSSFNIIFLFFSIYIHRILILLNHTTLMIKYSVLQLISNILISYILVYYLGATGIIVGTLLSFIIGTLFLMLHKNIRTITFEYFNLFNSIHFIKKIIFNI